MILWISRTVFQSKVFKSYSKSRHPFTKQNMPALSTILKKYTFLNAVKNANVHFFSLELRLKALRKNYEYRPGLGSRDNAREGSPPGPSGTLKTIAVVMIMNLTTCLIPLSNFREILKKVDEAFNVGSYMTFLLARVPK